MGQADSYNRDTGVFDFYRWPAPLFETPEEVYTYLAGQHLEGKTLREIHGVGYIKTARETGIAPLLYRRILGAGIQPEENWGVSYPYLDRVLLPQKVALCEPCQLFFTDGSTLELLPMERGGARIGVNSIPPRLCRGLNRSNFDLNNFFAETWNKTVKGFFYEILETAGQPGGNGTPEAEKELFTQRRKGYRLSFRLASSGALTLEWGRDSWYWLSIKAGGYDFISGPEDHQVSFQRLKRSFRELEQIPIVNGRDRGEKMFWIAPLDTSGRRKPGKKLLDGYGISLSDGDVAEFLSEFLLKYYDPEEQKRAGFSEDGFNWHGSSRYPFPVVEKMLAELRYTGRLLETDFDHTALDRIRQRLLWYPYTNEAPEKVTEARKNELRKHRARLAADFYRRLCGRLERMMTLPGYDSICFTGP